MADKIHIPVFISGKVAMAPPDARIVCGNDDYVIDFAFDEPWASMDTKIALFTFKRNNCPGSEEVEFTGTSVNVPVLHGIKQVNVGVYAGNLQTTTGAKIPCDPSILDTAPENGEVPPTEEVRLNARIDAVVAEAAAIREFAEKLAANTAALHVVITDNGDGTGTADKTFAEISEAFAQGRTVIGRIDSDGTIGVAQNVMTFDGTNAGISGLSGDGSLWAAVISAEETIVVSVVLSTPNPYALTFTGAVSATYDGGKAVTVEIPDSYTKTEIDAVMGSYITDIDTLVGGDG